MTPASSLVLLNTGVPGLNDVLGGGLPAYSFNLIAGAPGSGKTTLAMQCMFGIATPKRPGLYITMLGESSVKMLRYQQLFGFFDASQIGSSVHFLNLSEEALTGDLDALLFRITQEVERLGPGIVVVDSYRSLVKAAEAPEGYVEQFVQRLSLHLATWEITTLLIGEYPDQELGDPVFTVADGILWLSQTTHRNSVVRRLQVVKSRGSAPMPGLHTIRLSHDGIQIFPRIPTRRGDAPTRGLTRLSTGIVGLDAMMGGGIPAGDSVVLAGPTGTGKTTFAIRFVAAGLQAGEAAVIVIFEEHPEAYLSRARAVDVDLPRAISDDRMRIIYLRPLDLSVDETLEEIRSAVAAIGATRVVIDSLSGFEMALAPAFREDFRESLYRLIGALTALGVTVFSTVEVVGKDGTSALQFTGYQVSFLTDDIISMRYVEIEGELRTVLVVVKMRGSQHSRDFRAYEITATGVQLRETMRHYDAVASGSPIRQLRAPVETFPGLTTSEMQVLEAITTSGPTDSPEIAQTTGLGPDLMPELLDRLVRLEYVTKSGSRFRATARAPDS
ncbi:MAG: ATPase domain-containing protein [Gemmatimonadales bacterium]